MVNQEFNSIRQCLPVKPSSEIARCMEFTEYDFGEGKVEEEGRRQLSAVAGATVVKKEYLTAMKKSVELSDDGSTLCADVSKSERFLMPFISLFHSIPRR